MTTKKITLLVILGITIRIVAASFLYHPDIKTIYYDSATDYKQRLFTKNPLPYPPLVYIFFQNYQQRFHWLFSKNFDNWMADWGIMQVDAHPGIFQDLLVMKLPLLLFDLAVGYLLWRMADKKNKNTILFLWLLNPVTLYAIYANGQFDIIPTFLVLLSLYFWKEKKEAISYSLLGLAGGLKLFPLLLIPLLFVLDRRRLLLKLVTIFASALFFAITLLPGGFSSNAVRAIFTSNLAGSMFKAGIDLGNGAFLSLSLFVYTGLLLYLWISRQKPTLDEVFLIVLILILGLSRFHPQWITWIAPLFVLMLSDGRIDGRVGIWLSASYFGIMLFMSDKFTNFGLLKAVNNAFDTLPPPRYYLDLMGIGAQIYDFFVAAFLSGGMLVTLNLLKHKRADLDLGKLKLLDNSNKFVFAGALLVLALFLLVHIPLTLEGRYLDYESYSQNFTLVMTKDTQISQEIKAVNNNLNSIQVMIKNVNLRNKSGLVWKLKALDKSEVASGVVGGSMIADDFDVILKFPAVADSGGKTYTLELSSPDTLAGYEFVIPYDKEVLGAMRVADKEVGKLAYRTFFNPGGYKTNLAYSLKNISRKLY